MNTEIAPELLKKREKHCYVVKQWNKNHPEKIKALNKLYKSKEYNPEYYEKEKKRLKKISEYKSEYLKFKRAIPWFLTN